jgi:hypothetical protein
LTSWHVSESGATVALDDARRGTLTVTVTNPGPDQDRAMLTVTPLDGAAREWFSIDEPQRTIGGGDSAVYVVTIEVPPGVTEGTYAFQPIAYSADRDPGETSTTGRRISFDVGPSERRPFPWWVVAAVVALVVLIGGVALILTRGDPPAAQQAPTTASTTQEPEGPTVVAIDAPTTFTCGSGPFFDSPAEFTLRWETVGAVSVTVSIEDPDGPFETDLPPDGELVVPAPCRPESRTYFVVAIGADGTTDVRAHTVRGI